MQTSKPLKIIIRNVSYLCELNFFFMKGANINLDYIDDYYMRFACMKRM